MNKKKLYATSIIACLIFVMGFAIILKITERNKKCTAKDGILMRSYSGYICVNKDAIVK